MSKKIIRVAVVGCGKISIVRHAPEYHNNPNCEIIGFYDYNTEKAQELADIYGGKVFASFEEVLADKTIDAVSICTPNVLHADNCLKALEAGKDVLVEKPMAVTAEEAIAMVDKAKETGRILMPGHNQRFVSAHNKAKELIKNGTIGRVISIQTNFTHSGPEIWSVEKQNSWFFSDTLAGFGVLGDLGSHKIDLVRYLLDDEIMELTAMLDTLDKKTSDGTPIALEDNATCIFKTENGIKGTMNVSWTNYGKEDNSTIVYGSLGTMNIYGSDLDDIVIDMKDGTVAKYSVGKISSNTEQLNSHIIDAFIDACLSRNEPIVTGVDGKNTLLSLLAAIESHKTGKIQKIAY